MKAERNLFSQIILVAESRSVNMKDVLSTGAIATMPGPLANADGSLRKTNMTDLARELENFLSPADAEAIPMPSTCIIDGIKDEWQQQIFAQVTESVLSMALYVVDRVVGLVLSLTSVKYSESINRRASTTLQYKCLAGGHNIQQCRQFLCSSFNKTKSHQFIGWRVDTTAIQGYAKKPASR